MKVLIVYESMFGNTAALAEAVTSGLTDAGAVVALSEVTSVPAEGLLGCDLLVLAAPTHALTLSRPASRAEAVSKGADSLHATTGLREWLPNLDVTLPVNAPRPSIAVFDTRMGKGRHWPGSAARSVERIMKKSGFAIVGRASFYVDAVAGPLAAGEQERARDWGRALADLVPRGEADSEVGDPPQSVPA